ncbi:Uncharacterized protein dnm_096840 [Desulfonema magnum]|uniref:Uncharacterized protein n=1 Tax=Desulfonema magnum TaxID=45655 RepID=A0A975GTZ6_9BACT|nr:Uncharacterized protein dnm_096840 [Desulfonema magnum]
MLRVYESEAGFSMKFPSADAIFFFGVYTNSLQSLCPKILSGVF